MRIRLLSGWTAVVVIALATVAIWLADINLPLGNSDDGRLLAFSGLHARNFWDLGLWESRLGALVDPFIRREFGVPPRTVAPIEAVTYAHHPPLKEFLSILSAGVFGDGPAGLRVPIYLLGVSTLFFMASLLRACDLRWGPTLLAVGSMACTGFFYVYGRLGVSFSLLLAVAAAVAWIRKSDQPSRWALLGLGCAAALAAMQSWIAIAALGPLGLWLFASRYRNRQAAAGRVVSAGPSSGPWLAERWSRSEGWSDEAGSWRSPEQSLVTGSPPSVDRSHRASSSRSLRQWLATGWSPALTVFAVGAVIGLAITAGWMLYATGFTELADRVGLRTGNVAGSGDQQISFGFGEFLARQWRFATEELLVPPWLRFLLVPALIAGLADRRTRVAVAITLAVSAALTFGIRQGAWVHRLWNFPWLMPVTIGLAALLDQAGRRIQSSWRAALGVAGAAVIAVTMFAVMAGSTRDRYITDPADVGRALELAASRPEAAAAEAAWVGRSLPTPRWASYYLDIPVFYLVDHPLDQVHPTDIVILRPSRLPDDFPPEALHAPLATAGDFTVITAHPPLATPRPNE